MRIGAHVSAAGGLLAMCERAAALEASVAQCFLSSPRTWSFRPAPSPDRTALAEALERCGVETIVVHASYLINLASSNEELWSRSVALLGATLRAAEERGLEAVVVHAGAGGEDPTTIVAERVQAGLREALQGTERVAVWVENPASGMASWPLEHLDTLVAELDPARRGLCLDTQHLFAAGIDLTDPDMMRELVEAVARLRAPVRLVHLNDSASPLGSRRDRHANLGEGSIGAQALARVLRAPVFAEADVVLEVPGEGAGPRASDIQQARGLLR